MTPHGPAVTSRRPIASANERHSGDEESEASDASAEARNPWGGLFGLVIFLLLGLAGAAQLLRASRVLERLDTPAVRSTEP